MSVDANDNLKNLFLFCIFIILFIQGMIPFSYFYIITITPQRAEA
jgi:hypothetical protein